eukprot:TRINITY_DN77711_c0_g1_i2.p2 TRINITY_DN77711_c0_g1~~TRINITY_DN77711_c0_g1_i2.p2  ORF type:complete len:122 (-),score=31.67 TRINITY_DN77711_c0_g1_i2:196-561(-)
MMSEPVVEDRQLVILEDEQVEAEESQLEGADDVDNLTDDDDQDEGANIFQEVRTRYRRARVNDDEDEALSDIFQKEKGGLKNTKINVISSAKGTGSGKMQGRIQGSTRTLERISGIKRKNR